MSALHPYLYLLIVDEFIIQMSTRLNTVVYDVVLGDDNREALNGNVRESIGEK